MIRAIIVALGLTALVAGCNTVRGAGQDISAGGEAISNSSTEVQQELSE